MKSHSIRSRVDNLYDQYKLMHADVPSAKNIALLEELYAYIDMPSEPLPVINTRLFVFH
jgi:hypothetical protein